MVSARIDGSMVALAAETPVLDSAIDTHIGGLCEAMLVPHLYPADQRGTGANRFLLPRPVMDTHLTDCSKLCQPL